MNDNQAQCYGICHQVQISGCGVIMQGGSWLPTARYCSGLRHMMLHEYYRDYSSSFIGFMPENGGT